MDSKVLSKLQIIEEYLKRKNPEKETIKMIINEESDIRLLKHLFNIYSLYIKKIEKEALEVDINFLNNIQTIILDIIKNEKIDNIDSYLGKIRKDKKILLDISKNNNYKNSTTFLFSITDAIEKEIILKHKQEYKDNNYEFLSYIINDIQNKNYLDYVLSLYPHYVNAKNEYGEHIIVNIFEIFLDEILITGIHNINKILYYESVINKFLSNGRFKVENSVLREIKIKANKCFEELEKNKTYIRKYSQKEICLTSIIKKLNLDKTYYDSIESLDQKYNIKTGFSIETQKEIENLNVNNDPIVITIDDDNTLDMDDAISVKKNQETYTISVFISDVASVIKQGTSIDIEASSRFSTLYLSDKTIPMLPFELSNDLLSLKPNVNRNVIAYEIEIDKKGEIIKSNIITKQINVSNKLSYRLVNQYLERGYAQNESLYELIKTLSDVSLILRKNNVIKNSYRQIEDLSRKLYGVDVQNEYNNRTKAEIIVEEFMILGNMASAKYALDNSLPYIFRVHPKIEDSKDYEALSKLKDIVNKDYYKISNESYLDVISNLIKMYPNAYYSNENIGHFGLGLDTYSHSTSPIRRYADLINQRIIHDLFLQKPTLKRVKYWEKAVKDLCKQMNFLEELNKKYAQEYEKIKSLKKRG